jgi:hypothetical protein
VSNWQSFGKEEGSPGWGTSFVRQLRIWAGLAYHSSLGGLRKLQRTQIKLVVKLAPLDVADATALGERLFQEPPKDVAEKQLRDAAVTYLAKEANSKLEPDEWLTLAQVLRTLRQDYQQDVLSQMVHAALHRARTKVATPAPAKAPAYQVQSFAGLPLPGVSPFAYLSMGLAAISVLLIGWAWVAETRIERLKTENREYERYTKIVEEDAKRAAARAIDAEARVGQANASVAETAKRATDVIKRESERQSTAAAMRRREEARREQERSTNPDRVVGEPSDWLRDLAIQPLLSAPTIAAPDAPGAAGGGDPGGVPGGPGGQTGPSR